MILSEFPDIVWLRHQIETQFASQKSWDGRMLPSPNWPNVIINTTVSQTLRDNIKGPLSIFCNLSGSSSVYLNKRKVKTHAGSFIISNIGQEYTLEIEDQRTETFNIHFGENFTRNAFQAATGSHEMLLENVFSQSSTFSNRLQFTNAQFDQILLELKTAEDEMQQEEILYRLFLNILTREIDLNKQQAKIPVAKKSSQAEILKRLLLATDYIHSYYDAPLSLDELSRVSCLSKFHFLRMFKSTFHKTPYQFINDLRLQQAKQLLSLSTMEVKVVARKVGFVNSSSFSRLFYKNTGLYPSQFRRN